MLHKASTTSTAQKAGETTLMRAEAELVAIENRKKKAELLNDVGEPIALGGKALGLEVEDKTGRVWVAENTAVVRVVDLESGKTVQLYGGHTAPCTALAFYDASTHGRVLISGSWDKSIRIWNTTTRAEISATLNAHSDFVKTLLVIADLKLLVSSGSDKIVRIWDLSKLEEGKPLNSVASITSHTRPVEALAQGPSTSASLATLFTADTMGVIRAWHLQIDDASGVGAERARWKATLLHELNAHRTGVTDMHFGRGLLWTASLDESVQVQSYPPALTAGGTGGKVASSMEHGVGVKCLLPLSITPLGANVEDEDNDYPFVLTGAGDRIRVWVISEVNKPREVGSAGVDGHWHDVTAIRLWMRQGVPWIVSTGLDGMIRRWRLSELLKTKEQRTEEELIRTGCKKKEEEKKEKDGFELTDDEERELAELMGDDD